MYFINLYIQIYTYSHIALANNSYSIYTEIVNEIDDLEHKRETVEEQRQTIKKLDQDQVRDQ